MKKLITIIGMLLIAELLLAGGITGTVTNTKTNTAVDFGQVTIYNSGFKRTTSIQGNGDYTFSGLSAGTYTIATEAAGIFDTIVGVIVNNDDVTYLAINLVENASILGTATTTTKRPYNNALINPYQVHPGMVTTASEIKNMGRVDLAAIVSVNSNVQVSANNEISIRGSRPTATRIMIDGVYSVATVPTTAIKVVQVYAGGIPAKYGDTSGGVIVIETKSYFDQY